MKKCCESRHEEDEKMFTRDQNVYGIRLTSLKTIRFE